MFSAEDFELPLEKQLRMRVIKEEISNCSDVEELRKQLSSCAESLMRYQHLLTKAVEQNLINEVNKLFVESKSITEITNDN